MNQTKINHVGPKMIKYDMATIVKEFTLGKTMASIAEGYGVSRERIRQILNKMDIRRKDGGASVRGDINKKVRIIQRQMSLVRRTKEWGFDNVEEFIFHTKTYGTSADSQSPMSRYLHHRVNINRKAKGQWNITFKEWWAVWEESGKWAGRGPGKYGNRLIDPSKPWQPGNVEVFHIKGTPRRASNESTMFDDYKRELRNSR